MPAQNFNLKLEPYSSLINQLPRYDFSFQKLQTSQDVKKQFSENYNNQQLIQFNNYLNNLSEVLKNKYNVLNLRPDLINKTMIESIGQKEFSSKVLGIGGPQDRSTTIEPDGPVIIDFVPRASMTIDLIIDDVAAEIPTLVTQTELETLTKRLYFQNLPEISESPDYYLNSKKSQFFDSKIENSANSSILSEYILAPEKTTESIRYDESIIIYITMPLLVLVFSYLIFFFFSTCFKICGALSSRKPKASRPKKIHDEVLNSSSDQNSSSNSSENTRDRREDDPMSEAVLLLKNQSADGKSDKNNNKIVTKHYCSKIISISIILIGILSTISAIYSNLTTHKVKVETQNKFFKLYDIQVDYHNQFFKAHNLIENTRKIVLKLQESNSKSSDAQNTESSNSIIDKWFSKKIKVLDDQILGPIKYDIPMPNEKFLQFIGNYLENSLKIEDLRSNIVMAFCGIQIFLYLFGIYGFLTVEINLNSSLNPKNNRHKGTKTKITKIDKKSSFPNASTTGLNIFVIFISMALVCLSMILMFNLNLILRMVDFCNLGAYDLKQLAVNRLMRYHQIDFDVSKNVILNFDLVNYVGLDSDCSEQSNQIYDFPKYLENYRKFQDGFKRIIFFLDSNKKADSMQQIKLLDSNLSSGYDSIETAENYLSNCAQVQSDYYGVFEQYCKVELQSWLYLTFSIVGIFVVNILLFYCGWITILKIGREFEEFMKNRFVFQNNNSNSSRPNSKKTISPSSSKQKMLPSQKLRHPSSQSTCHSVKSMRSSIHSTPDRSSIKSATGNSASNNRNTNSVSNDRSSTHTKEMVIVAPRIPQKARYVSGPGRSENANNDFEFRRPVSQNNHNNFYLNHNQASSMQGALNDANNIQEYQTKIALPNFNKNINNNNINHNNARPNSIATTSQPYSNNYSNYKYKNNNNNFNYENVQLKNMLVRNTTTEGNNNACSSKMMNESMCVEYKGISAVNGINN